MFRISRPLGTSIPKGYPSTVRTATPSEGIRLSRIQPGCYAPLRRALANYLKLILDRPIRHVVAYEEHTENYGGCSTCEHHELVFDVYFKDQSGRLLLYRYTGAFSELIRGITADTASEQELI